MEKELHKFYESNKKSKLIFSVKLCEFLLSKGHRLIEFKEHKKAQNKLVFVFKNTNELHYSIDEYLAIKETAKS